MHVVEDGQPLNPRKRFGLCGGRVDYFDGVALTRHGVARLRSMCEDWERSRMKSIAHEALDGVCAECIAIVDRDAEGGGKG